MSCSSTRCAPWCAAGDMQHAVLLTGGVGCRVQHAVAVVWMPTLQRYYCWCNVVCLCAACRILPHPSRRSTTGASTCCRRRCRGARNASTSPSSMQPRTCRVGTCVQPAALLLQARARQRGGCLWQMQTAYVARELDKQAAANNRWAACCCGCRRLPAGV